MFMQFLRPHRHIKQDERASSAFRRKTGESGFTLVEMLVAVSIMIILSATLLVNYGSFDSRLTVTLLAHQIAGWVHETQVSAMSIRRALNEGTQFPGYGLYFNASDPKKFIFFADLDRDRVYDPYDPVSGKCGDVSEECEQEVTLLRGNVIASLCGDQPSSSGQAASCASVITGSPALYPSNEAHIVFMRPNPFDATIYGDPDTDNPPALTSHSHAEVTVVSPKGYRHTIIIWITGQVSIQ